MFATQSQPLRFGISLPNRAMLFGLPSQVLLETAEQAEAAELISSLWVGNNLRAGRTHQAAHARYGLPG